MLTWGRLQLDQFAGKAYVAAPAACLAPAVRLSKERLRAAVDVAD